MLALNSLIRFRDVPLALFAAMACLLCLGDAVAQSADEGDEPSRVVPAPVATSGQGAPYELEADVLSGYLSGQFQARGKVILKGPDLRLWGENLFGSEPDNEFSATGGAGIERGGDTYTGERFFIDLDDYSGYIEAPTYALSVEGIHGSAERVDFQDRDRFRATKGTYTTCDLGQDDWYLTTSRLDIDRVRDIGVARNVTLRFMGVPILYTPWIDFPIQSKRKTGLLGPIFGTSKTGGFELTQPIYLNLAPNYDATIAPRYISKRGQMLNGEFRYMSGNFAGEMRSEYLDEDRLTGEARYGGALKHVHSFGRGWTGELNLNKVSDDRYFVDLSDRIAATSQTNLPREALLAYSAGWWSAGLRTQRFQTLQDPLAPVLPPYARYPQFNLNAARPNTYGLDLNFSGEVVNFKHPTLVNAVRQLYYPSVQLPMESKYFTLVPKVGVHYRRYHFTEEDRKGQEVTLPIASLDASIPLERDASFFGRSFVQTVDPRLYYVYIPFKDQSRLPLFDTAEADFNLGQIFTENQFTGGDRVNDANQLTAAVTTRLIDPETGEELLRGTLAQRFYFKDQEVSLTSQVRQSNRSDLLAAVSGRLTSEWAIDSALQYDANNSQWQRANATLRYQVATGKVANLGYRYQKDSLKTVDVSAQWPLSSRWTGLGRWNYSLQDHKLVEGLAGLEYNRDCWAVRVVAHRFATSTQVASTTFFMQLEFTGLTGLGSNPLEVLRQSIFGYTKTNEGSRPTTDTNLR